VGNRTRTLLVVLSIAVGVFAVGTIAAAHALLQQTIHDAYAASQPSAITFYTGVFDDGLVDSVRRMRGVATRRRGGTSPCGCRRVRTRTVSLPWLPSPDFKHQRLDYVTPEAGNWPPKRGEIALERSSLRLESWLVPGTPVTVLTAGTGRRTVSRSGRATTRPEAAPGFYYGRLQGHVTFDTLEDLGFGRQYDELRVRLTDTALDKAA